MPTALFLDAGQCYKRTVLACNRVQGKSGNQALMSRYQLLLKSSDRNRWN